MSHKANQEVLEDLVNVCLSMIAVTNGNDSLHGEQRILLNTLRKHAVGRIWTPDEFDSFVKELQNR